MEPVVARQTWRTLEPIHGMVYFAPEAREAYEAVGLTGARMGYFASRAAAMGPVPAELVIATFFNFNPELVRRVIPAAWSQASPEAVLAARLDVVDRALRRALGPAGSGPELGEAAALARIAAEAAVPDIAGRPLFAAHARLPWPDEDHLVLWHAQTLLREYRGDGHVATLLSEGLDAGEALVLHGATGEVPAEMLRRSRDWPEADWEAAVERVRARGWLDDGGEPVLNGAGRAHRQRIEDRTDELAVRPYRSIGEDGCSRLRQLARPLSRAVLDAGLLPVDPQTFLSDE